MKQDLREATRYPGPPPRLCRGYRAHARSRDRRQLDDLQRPQRRAAAPAGLRPARLSWSVIWESNAAQGRSARKLRRRPISTGASAASSFSTMGIYRYRGYTLTGAGEAERLITVDVSPVLFALLGVPTVLGRTFTEDEERPGERVAQGRAQLRRLGAALRPRSRRHRPHDDPGRCAARDRRRDAARRSGCRPTIPTSTLWSPLTLNLGALASRPHRMYNAIGRLAPGAGDRSGARGDGRDCRRRSRARIPTRTRDWGVALVPAHEQVVGRIGDTLWVLFGAVVLVLVIACANIANLLLARSATAAKRLRALRGVRRRPLGADPPIARRKQRAHAGAAARSGCCSRGGARGRCGR